MYSLTDRILFFLSVFYLPRANSMKSKRKTKSPRPSGFVAKARGKVQSTRQVRRGGIR